MSKTETLKLSDEEILEDILEKTNKIHASFLFWGPATDLLQKLSINLCATPISTRYNGWIELGVKLGLGRSEVLSIENTHILNEDPVYIMLLAYSQKENSTIANIYYSLSELKRKDVISETYPIALKFCEEILQSYSTGIDGLLKPPSIPKPPHIFKKFKEQDVKNIKPKQSKSKRKNQKIVTLTYVPEDIEIVQEVTKEFRKDGVCIGVLTLEEQRNYVLKDPINMIFTFLRNSDYYIPIVTNNYLSQIEKQMAGSVDHISSSCIDNLDGHYALFIYNKIMNDYMTSGCKNEKVRSIIPNNDFETVLKHDLFQPLFQAWTKQSDISNMAKCILDNKI